LERPEFRKIFTEGLYRLRDRIWPVVLDAEELIKIFSSTVTIGSWGTTLDLAGGADVDETGPIHHAARAIADQHNAFFDLFRTRTRQLIAIGIYSGEQKEIPSATWSLANKWLDLKSGGLFDKGDNDTGFFRMPWEAVEVLPMRTKIANPPAAAAANKPKDSESAPSGPRRRRPIQSRVEDQMIAEIKQGRLTREGLEDMLQKEMLNRFNALSRDTCCKARKAVLVRMSLDK
jgi:hypothetical protein